MKVKLKVSQRSLSNITNRGILIFIVEHISGLLIRMMEQQIIWMRDLRKSRIIFLKNTLDIKKNLYLSHENKIKW